MGHLMKDEPHPAILADWQEARAFTDAQLIAQGQALKRAEAAEARIEAAAFQVAEAQTELARAVARAAEAGDRAEGLEVMLEHTRAKRVQAEERVANASCFAQAERERAEVAERWATAWKRAAKRWREYFHARPMPQELTWKDRAEAAEAALEPLRRMAQAVSRNGGLVPVHLRTWADTYERELGYEGANLCVWLRSVAAALAALDAARGKGGNEGEQEHILGEGEAPSALA